MRPGTSSGALRLADGAKELGVRDGGTRGARGGERASGPGLKRSNAILKTRAALVEKADFLLVSLEPAEDFRVSAVVEFGDVRVKLLGEAVPRDALGSDALRNGKAKAWVDRRGPRAIGDNLRDKAAGRSGSRECA